MKNQPKVLIIDDDEKLAGLLSEYLQKFNYQVDCAHHPAQGLKMIKTFSPDIVLLDIMLPDQNGFAVCQQIRKSSRVPIIMLTARGEVTDRVVGLEVGADDYIAKPFEAREIVARIQAVLRRSRLSPAQLDKINVGDISIDPAAQKVKLQNKVLKLTTMEYETLVLLASHAGQVISRDQVVEALKGEEFTPFNRSVDILMSRLRQKLNDDPQNPRYLKTVWGRGYIFVAEESNE